MNKFNVVLLLLVLLPGLFQACATYEPAFAGDAHERYDTHEEAGFDREKLEALTAFIDRNSATTGLIVLFKGKQVYEYGDLSRISYIASCRKSVLSMLYGKYVEDGIIDLGTSIGEIGIDEKDGLLPMEKTATIDDIITSRSGVFHVASNAGYDKDNFLERGSVEPGDYFVYNNWDFNVAGYILEYYTRSSIYEELEQQFAIPLGFQDWNIENQKKSGKKSRSQYPAYHMYLSTRDMAKLGQLMLNRGEWNGKQLVSEDWINKTTATVTPFETLVERYGPVAEDDIHMSYGYMWWLIDNYRDKKEYRGAYSAIGYGGQYITIFPGIELVIAHKTKLGFFQWIGMAEDGDAHYWDIVHRIIDAKK